MSSWLSKQTCRPTDLITMVNSWYIDNISEEYYLFNRKGDRLTVKGKEAGPLKEVVDAENGETDIKVYIIFSHLSIIKMPCKHIPISENHILSAELG